MTVKERKEQLRRRGGTVILIVLQLSWIVPCGIKYHQDYIKHPPMIEETEDILRYDMETVEVETEDTKEEVYTNDTGIRLYDVPLSEELQIYTLQECDGYSIAPSIPLAIMDAESDFIADKVSPNGAIGIMQIVPRWHEDRMDMLGCTDLYDPFQNIKVGMNYLAYLIDINPDPYWVLMAYRKGPKKATEYINSGYIMDYALEVLERAQELEEEYGCDG